MLEQQQEFVVIWYLWLSYPCLKTLHVSHKTQLITCKNLFDEICATVLKSKHKQTEQQIT